MNFIRHLLLACALLAGIPCFAADSKISDLTSGTAPASGDLFIIARSGTDYKLTWAQMVAGLAPIASPTFTGTVTGPTITASTTINAPFITLGASGILQGGANLLEQRNGTNAQLFNVYKTYTSATNYERLRVGSDGTNYFVLSGPGSGGGSHRTMYVGYDQSVANSASPLIIQGGGAAGAVVYVNVGNANKATFYDTAGKGASFDAGTATTDVAALSVTRTNNNAAVATGVQFAFTDTLSAAGFLPFQVLGGAAGTTNLLSLSKTGVGTFGTDAVAQGTVIGNFGLVAGIQTSGIASTRGGANADRIIFDAAAGIQFYQNTGLNMYLANANRLSLSTSMTVGYAFASSSDASAAADTNLNRISAGVVGCGTGTAGSTACTFQAASLLAATHDRITAGALTIGGTATSLVIPNATVTSAASGTRFLCISTAGLVTSSASACSGT